MALKIPADLQEAFGRLCRPTAEHNWLKCAYLPGQAELSLSGCGAGTWGDFVAALHPDNIEWALFKFASGDGDATKLLRLCWLPPSCSGLARARVSVHKPVINEYFQAHYEIFAESSDDLLEEEVARRVGLEAAILTPAPTTQAAAAPTSAQPTPQPSPAAPIAVTAATPAAAPAATATQEPAEQDASSGGIRLKWGVGSLQGVRPTMEDEHCCVRLPSNPAYHFFSVFDGHAGPEASAEASRELFKFIDRGLVGAGDRKEAIENAFLKMDSKLDQLGKRQGWSSGSTVISTLVNTEESFVICANLGDSRCVLCRDGKAMPLSIDHKPTNPLENERITAAGSHVWFGRVGGSHAVSRALGDRFMKQAAHVPAAAQAISPMPEVLGEPLDVASDEFMILACDGLWDVMANQDAVDFVRNGLRNTANLDTVAQRLVKHALDLGSLDNVSAIIVKFFPANSTDNFIGGDFTHESSAMSEKDIAFPPEDGLVASWGHSTLLQAPPLVALTSAGPLPNDNDSLIFCMAAPFTDDSSAAVKALEVFPCHLASALRQSDDKREAIEAAFFGADSKVNQAQNAARTSVGCSFMTAVVNTSERFLIVANVGDGRCVLYRSGRPVSLSHRHTLDEFDRRRVDDAGCKVINGKIDGTIPVARALGLPAYKTNDDPLLCAVSPLPEVIALPLESQDEFVVLANEGVWSRMTAEQVYLFIKPQLGKKNPFDIARELVWRARSSAASMGLPPLNNETAAAVLITFTPMSKAAAPLPLQGTIMPAIFPSEKAKEAAPAAPATQPESAKGAANEANDDDDDDDDDEIIEKEVLWDIAHNQGPRPTQEDTDYSGPLQSTPDQMLFAVFDGHAGPEASEFCQENFASFLDDALAADDNIVEAIKAAFITVDTEFEAEAVDNYWYSGTTMTGVLINPEKGSLISINLGDSRTVLCRNGKAIPLTRDHKPTDLDELARIEAAGFKVVNGRVDGSHAVSRSIGDRKLKGKMNLSHAEQAISVIPDITGDRLKRTDEFIIVACDGLWDVLSNDEAVSWVRGKLAERQGSVEGLSAELCQHAVSIGSQDNVSAIIVLLKNK